MEKFIALGDQNLIVRELLLSGELGGTIWDAAYVMLKYIEELKDYIKDKRIIELGSGTGILGIGAALLGANVVLTDLPQLVGLMQENIKLNKIESRCKAAALKWGDDVTPFNPPYDVILISDVITVLYADDFKKLINSINDLSDGNTRIILGFEKRYRNKEEEFFKLLLNERFTYESIACKEDWDPYYKESNRLIIYEIKKKNNGS